MLDDKFVDGTFFHETRLFEQFVTEKRLVVHACSSLVRTTFNEQILDGECCVAQNFVKYLFNEEVLSNSFDTHLRA